MFSANNIRKLYLFTLVVFMIFLPVRYLFAAEDLDKPSTNFNRQQIENIIKEYLIENPEIISEAMEALERKMQEEQKQKISEVINENSKLLYESNYDFSKGAKNSDIVLIEFFDYNCGYCKKSLENIISLLDNDKNLKIIFKEFPVLGEGSVIAAQAAIASKKQGKYWDFHVALMKTPFLNHKKKVLEVAKSVGIDIAKLEKDMQNSDIDDALEESMVVASSLDIEGTPAFIIGGELVPGYVDLEYLKNVISKAREKK